MGSGQNERMKRIRLKYADCGNTHPTEENHMKTPRIPDNRLKEKIEQLIRLCEKVEDDYGTHAFTFGNGLSDTEIKRWETEIGIRIPASCKDWLQFSGSSKICGNLAIFSSPDAFIIQNNKKPCDVPDDCIVIGTLGGWGVSLCFSAATGEIMYIDHGEQCVVSDFGEILDWVINLLEASI